MGLVVALVVTSALGLMTWAIGDRWDWAVCPGQNCNSGGIDWSDSWGEVLLVGLVAGLGATFLEWFSRWVNAKLRPRPPGPGDSKGRSQVTSPHLL